MGLIDVRWPRRVDSSGNTLEEYHPLSMSLDLNIIPLSTATMDLPRSEYIPARSYVELFTPLGSAGFFRVRSPEDAYGEDITSVELEHAITEVGDYLVKAKYDEMMAANTAMQTVFSDYGGGRWRLGDVSALGAGEIALSVNYDRVLDAMLGILEQKQNCYLAFDFTTSPWTVSVAQRDTVVSAEGRLSRNIDSAKVIYDDTELCTRVYYEHATTTDSIEGLNLDGIPTFDANDNYSAGAYVVYDNHLYQLPNGHEAEETWANTVSILQEDIPTSEWTYLDADTISKYGIIERTVSTSTDYTDEESLQTAQEFIRTHKEPRVSVVIQAEELAHATGESWDTFTIGKLLRLALVDYDVTVERNITGLSWADVYNDPESMEVNLGEEEDTAITFLHDVDTNGSSGSGGGGGGGSRKKQDDQWKEYFTEFEQDDYHFRLVAKHVDEMDNILQQAGLYIDSDGVLIYADNFENSIGSKLSVQADKIAMVVGTYDDGENFIKAGEISLAINETTGESIATIDANHINISATNTLHTLAGEIEVDDNGNLIIKSAGGMRVRRTEQGITSEYGVFDNGNLTAGVIVDKVNNGETNVGINANHVNISADSTFRALAGEMEVAPDGALVIKSGGGMFVQRTAAGVTSNFGVWDGGNLTAGVVATIVNGVPSTYISGDNIYIGNESSTVVIGRKLEAKDITADMIAARIADIAILRYKALNGGSIDCSGVKVNGNNLEVNGKAMMVSNITVDGNTLTITKTSGSTITFSKPDEVKVESSHSAGPYTTNGYKSVTPSSGYDAMKAVTFRVNVPTSQGGGGGCFAAGSMILLADGSELPIEKLTPGLILACYDPEQDEFSETEVMSLKAFKHRDDVFEIDLKSGRKLIVTDSHPLFTRDGWKALDPEKVIEEHHHSVETTTLTADDEILGMDGYVGIESIRYRNDLSDCTVYNIDVEEIDNYIVEGIVAHNADDGKN